MRHFIGKVLCLITLYAPCLVAQTQVWVTINQTNPGVTIPKDFIGLSFGPANMQPTANGGHVFDSTSTEMLNIFRVLGIEYFRIGGIWVDTNSVGYMPSRQDSSALFRFIKAAGLTAAYTLRLENGDSV